MQKSLENRCKEIEDALMVLAEEHAVANNEGDDARGKERERQRSDA